MGGIQTQDPCFLARLNILAHEIREVVSKGKGRENAPHEKHKPQIKEPFFKNSKGTRPGFCNHRHRACMLTLPMIQLCRLTRLFMKLNHILEKETI